MSVRSFLSSDLSRVLEEFGLNDPNVGLDAEEEDPEDGSAGSSVGCDDVFEGSVNVLFRCLNFLQA